MAAPSFFNENENRSYPFIFVSQDTANQPPHALIVDCGFVAGVKSRYSTTNNEIRLTAVRRQGSFFYFDFTADAPELFGVPLTFTRHVSDGDFASEFVDSGTAGLSDSSESRSRSDPGSACNEPLWSGFLVTGRMAALLALLPTDGEVTMLAEVEPALIQNLAASFVAKFALANGDRTRVTPSTDCGEDAVADEVIRINTTCIVGDVVFRPGYNANVRQSLQDNSITLGAAVGDGAGQPCATLPTYPGEVAPDGSSLLEGGQRCNETVRSVNGLGGPQLNLIAGRGVTVTSVPEENKLIVLVNMSGLALCFDSISHRSESC